MYIPKPADTSQIEIPEEIMMDGEVIAKNTHEVWAKGKLEEGYSYGDTCDPIRKTHSCLKEYELLTETEKDYDRRTAFETIKLLIKLGYKIERK